MVDSAEMIRTIRAECRTQKDEQDCEAIRKQIRDLEAQLGKKRGTLLTINTISTTEPTVLAQTRVATSLKKEHSKVMSTELLIFKSGLID